MLPCINGLHRRAQTMSSFILGTMPKTELGLYNNLPLRHARSSLQTDHTNFVTKLTEPCSPQ
jgi:hypothetical protein